MAAKLRTAVIGATGYSGMELTRFLSRHPHVGMPVLFRGAEGGGEVSDLPGPGGNGSYPLQTFSWPALKQCEAKLLFFATPHHVSRSLVPEAIQEGYRVVDLSGAWRLKQARYVSVYAFHDRDAQSASAVTARAVYGLPELHSEQIRTAEVVANPGCYATSIILALTPLLKADLIDRSRGIIADSKSGVSGAGKEPNARTHFVSVADNLSAYALFRHRHIGEIAEQLALEESEFTFTPHLLPIPRGIFSTLYVYLNCRISALEIESCLRCFYRGKPWVRIFTAQQLPEIQFALRTNYCDLGFCLAEDGRRLVLISCIDNLVKGAAGQAIQNMNLMYGWREEDGLQ